MEELKNQAEAEVEAIHIWATPKITVYPPHRDDTEVLDEPLYATFLQVTGSDRPYREEVLSKMEPDGNKVGRDIIYRPGRKKYRLCKHIAKQRVPELPSDFMKKGKHFLLIRNPLDILASFDKVVPPSLAELGLAEMVTIYSEPSQLGRPPPIVDAAELQLDPEATLSGLCEDLDIPFQPTMLKWEAGPKAIDGVWAPWWYETAHKSTGFQPTTKYPVVMDLVVKEKLVLEERRISLSEFHTADEVWTTGTMGELSPVVKIDGREVGDGKVGPVTRRLQIAYKELTAASGVPIPTYQET